MARLHFFKRITVIFIRFFKRIITYIHIYSGQSHIFTQKTIATHRNPKKTTTFIFNKRSVTY